MVEARRFSKNLTSKPTRLLISCMYLRNCFMYIICVSTIFSIIYISKLGLPRSGKKVWKMKIFQVREKSGNYIFSQGNLKKKMKKVMEKSGNFKFFLKRC